jgi:hydroxyacylglutathione hydrolase
LNFHAFRRLPGAPEGSLEIHQIGVLRDNYVYLLRDPSTDRTAVVDPSVSDEVLEALDRLGWSLDYILNTHHHPDHVGGNLAIQAATNAEIVGPGPDEARIPGIQHALNDGDRWVLGTQEAEIFFVPGHTLGHIAYWFAASEALFCGDTLFSIGCGRLFEGTPAQMWSSVTRLRALPDATRVCCGHEYTLSNIRFAQTVDPDNAALQAYRVQVEALRARDEPTVPSTMGLERRANPFLRADDPVLAARVGREGAAPAEVFGEVRARKDGF